MSRCKHVFVEQHTKTTLIYRCTIRGNSHGEHFNGTSGHRKTWTDTNVHDGMMA